MRIICLSARIWGKEPIAVANKGVLESAVKVVNVCISRVKRNLDVYTKG